MSKWRLVNACENTISCCYAKFSYLKFGIESHIPINMMGATALKANALLMRIGHVSKQVAHPFPLDDGVHGGHSEDLAGQCPAIVM